MALDATGTPTAILSIPKYNTAVDPPSGKGFNAAMDYIDSIINAHTGVNSAGTTILGNKLLSGDAQPAFTIKGDGDLAWGPGGATAPDINLYRAASDYLRTDNNFQVAKSAFIDLGGTGSALYFGSSADTNLYRSAANTLHTDDSFNVGGTLGTTGHIVSKAGHANQIALSDDGRLYFGNAADTNLYRSAANTLKTDDNFHTAGGIWLDTDGNNDVILFGTAGDTNLYRGGADVLQTDDVLRLSSGSGGVQGTIQFGSSADTNLYRTGAGNLRTDGAFYVGEGLVVDADDIGQKLYFGPTLDTNLYRSAAYTLATDNQFHIKNDYGLKFNDGSTQTTAAASGVNSPASIASGEVPTYNGSTYVRSTTTRIGLSSITPGLAGQVLQGTGPSYATPSGHEYAATSITADVTSTSITEAGAANVFTFDAITFDGSTTILIEVTGGYDHSVGGAQVYLSVKDGGTSQGIIAVTTIAAPGSYATGVTSRLRLTPSAGSHTYTVDIWGGAGTSRIKAGAGGAGTIVPATCRIIKA